MKNLSYTDITSWLLNIGLLKLEQLDDGKTKKSPTSAGVDAGITIEDRVSANGPYKVVVYNKSAQTIILNNLNDIIRTR